MENNYRFIDDILTLSGRIPSAEEYGMEYKSTRKRQGEVEYLGMKLVWREDGNGRCKVSSELLQREAAYPIRIIRYPAHDSLASDEQRMGVVMGQLIRAQRICSHMAGFKEAVLYITKCAFRRGCPRRRLCGTWGRFLGQWWAAQELRRGQLRSWFKRMTKYAKRVVREEDDTMNKPAQQKHGPSPVGEPWWNRGWQSPERGAHPESTLPRREEQEAARPPEMATTPVVNVDPKANRDGVDTDCSDMGGGDGEEPSQAAEDEQSQRASADHHLGETSITTEAATRSERPGDRNEDPEVVTLLRGLQQMGGQISHTTRNFLRRWWERSAINWISGNGGGDRLEPVEDNPSMGAEQNPERNPRQTAEHMVDTSDGSNGKRNEEEMREIPRGDSQARCGLWNRSGQAKGNLCYLNAGLQVLSRIMPRRHGQWVVGRTQPLTKALSEVLARMSWPGNRPALNPTAFRRAVYLLHPQFDDGRQHDALEAMGLIWATLQEEGRAAELEQNPTFRDVTAANDVVHETVEFEESSVVMCQECGYSSNTSKRATHVVLGVPERRSVSLEECLTDHFGGEILEKDNAYACPVCRRKVRGEKTLRLKTLPAVLVIGLKRTRYDKGPRDVRTEVHSPKQLDVGALSQQPHRTIMFDLVAVINHVGHAEWGHYTADLKGKVDGKWYTHDDEQVRQATGYRPREVAVLVYEQRDLGPIPVQRGEHHRKPPKSWTRERRSQTWDKLRQPQGLRRQQQIREGRIRPAAQLPEQWWEKVAMEEASRRFEMLMEETRARSRFRGMAQAEPQVAGQGLGKSREKEAERREDLEVEEQTDRLLLIEGARRGLQWLRHTCDKGAPAAERQGNTTPEREQERRGEGFAAPELRAEELDLAVEGGKHASADGRKTPGASGAGQGYLGEEQQIRAAEEWEANKRLELVDRWRDEMEKWKERRREMTELISAWQKERREQQERQKLQRLEEELSKSHYEGLGVDRKATTTAIRAAYRRMVLECHPDKYPQEAEKAKALFQMLRRAYETLTDPEARKTYDQILSAARGEAQEAQKAGTEPEPERPEPAGECGRFSVISLAKRYGMNPQAVRLEDAQIRKARGMLSIHSTPTRTGECWIIVPGWRIEKARYLGGQLVTKEGKTWEVQIAHIEGHSTAVELTPSVRLFCQQWEAVAVRRVVQGR